MHRIIVAGLIALAAWLATAERAHADSAAGADHWPVRSGPYIADKTGNIQRGEGGYLSPVKLLATWLLFVAWIAAVDWVNRDAQLHEQDYHKWNMKCVFPFLGVMVLSWISPSFWLGFPLLAASAFVPVWMYVKQRNAALDPEEHVLTREHLRGVAAKPLRRVGIKIEVKKVGPVPLPVTLTPQGGEQANDNAANLVRAKHSSGFRPAHELLHDALLKHARAVMLDFTRDAVTVRYQIDGVWLEAPGRDRASGDPILEVFKIITNRDPENRVDRQQGTFGLQHEKEKFTCRLTSQGTKTGERAVLQIDDGAPRKARLPECGMRPKMFEEFKALLGQKRGFVILSAPPGGGLTSLLNGGVAAIDRLMRSVASIEPAQHQDVGVDNVQVHLYDPLKGEAVKPVLVEVSRQYPDAIICPELADADTVLALCNEVAEDRLVVATVRAKEATEALFRVLMLKAPLKTVVAALTGVVNVRVIRKLCEQCKEAYQPPATVLQQLGLSPERVEAFYRPPTPKPPPDPPDPKNPPPGPCPACHGVGYRGQMGIYEFMIIDDNVRAVLLKEPKMETVKPAARKAGMRTMQEEGIALVVKGLTSLPELMRVLKEGKE